MPRTFRLRIRIARPQPYIVGSPRAATPAASFTPAFASPPPHRMTSPDRPTTPTPIAFQTHGWRGWVHADWQGLPAFQDIDAWLQETSAETILELPCRRITRHQTERGALYAKYMRAKNDSVIKNRELFNLIRWTLLPSRGQRIFLTCNAMLQHGHYCPQPVLGARRRRGPWGYPHELFVSAELIQPTVEELLQTYDDSGRAELLAHCAAQLQRFHSDHFVHGDFLPRNACFDTASKRLFYLDNDRTRLWPCRPPFASQRRNLAQFCYNLLLQAEGYDLTMPNAFLNAYLQATAWSEKRRQAEYQRIIAHITTRWRRFGEKELARLKRLAEQV